MGRKPKQEPRIKYGDVVIYAVTNRPIIGLASGIDRETGKYIVVPVSEANNETKRSESQLITMDNIQQAREILGKD